MSDEVLSARPAGGEDEPRSADGTGAASLDALYAQLRLAAGELKCRAPSLAQHSPLPLVERTPNDADANWRASFDHRQHQQQRSHADRLLGAMRRMAAAGRHTDCALVCRRERLQEDDDDEEDEEEDEDDEERGDRRGADQDNDDDDESQVDVETKLDGLETVRAHAVVLAAVSPFFEQQLSNNDRIDANGCRAIDLSAHPSWAVRRLVSFAYTGSLRLPADQTGARRLYALATHCQLDATLTAAGVAVAPGGREASLAQTPADASSTPPALCANYAPAPPPPPQPDADQPPALVANRQPDQQTLRESLLQQLSAGGQLSGPTALAACVKAVQRWEQDNALAHHAQQQHDAVDEHGDVAETRRTHTDEILALAAAHRALLQRQINEKRAVDEQRERQLAVDQRLLAIQQQQQQQLLQQQQQRQQQQQQPQPQQQQILMLPIVCSHQQQQLSPGYMQRPPISPNAASALGLMAAPMMEPPARLDDYADAKQHQQQQQHQALLAQLRSRQLLIQQQQQERAGAALDADGLSPVDPAAIVAAAALVNRRRQQQQLAERQEALCDLALKRRRVDSPSSMCDDQHRRRHASGGAAGAPAHDQQLVRQQQHQQQQPAAQARSPAAAANKRSQQVDGDQGWCRNKKYIERVPGGFMCTVCQKVYGRYNSVSYHVTIYHRNPPIECAEPGCKFTTREARYIHFHRYYRHGTPLPKTIDLGSRMCMFCRHIAKSPAMLDKHVRRHFNSQSGRMLGVSAEQLRAAQQHQQQQRRARNADNERPATNADGLATLAAAAACANPNANASANSTMGGGQSQSKPAVGAGAMVFRCSGCAQAFDTADALLAHEARAHMNQLCHGRAAAFARPLHATTPPPHQLPQRDVDDEELHCRLCRFKASSSGALRQHKLLAHAGSLTTGSMAAGGRQCASAEHHPPMFEAVGGGCSSSVACSPASGSPSHILNRHQMQQRSVSPAMPRLTAADDVDPPPLVVDYGRL